MYGMPTSVGTKPDRWVLVRLIDPNTQQLGDTLHVFCGWGGGYLSSDEWRLSTKIATMSGAVEEDDQNGRHIDVETASGSSYILLLGRIGLSGYAFGVLQSFIERGMISKHVIDTEEELVSECKLAK